MKLEPKVYFAKNTSEVTYHLKNTPNLSVLAGCTYIMQKQQDSTIRLPQSFVCIRNIPELTQITKNERSIEFGAAVSLEKILELETKKIPPILLHAIHTISNIPVRNLATIGGNICIRDFFHTTYAPLLALDALLEFKNHHDVFYMQLNKFIGIPSGTFLSKIKVPLEDWDIAVYKRFGPKYRISDTSASFALLIKIQNNLLADLRIAFAGAFSFKNRDFENILIGSKLPLSRRSLQDFILQADGYFTTHMAMHENTIDPMIKDQFLNLLRKSMECLL